MRYILKYCATLGLGVLIGILAHDIHNARQMQAVCKAEGYSECHIEWDGFGNGFEVYWRSDE